VDAATQALEGVTNTPQNAEKEKNQLESVSLAGLDVQRRNRLLSRMQVHADNLHLGLPSEIITSNVILRLVVRRGLHFRDLQQFCSS
jgi:hypothetical protein